MQEKVNKITSLIEKSLEEQISPAEQLELNEWLAESESNRLFFQQITDKEILREKMKLYASADSAAIWNKTLAKIDGGKLITMYPQRTSIKKYVAAAAAAAVLIIGGTYFYKTQQSHNALANTKNTDETFKTSILPGGSKATLTFADGNTINLQELGNGKILAKNGAETSITKTDGRLIYNRKPGSDAGQTIAYNTVTTPRGGEYQITLPDGSKVWLNAASSLRFPIAFAGNERIVELTGEAYFEVNAQNQASSTSKVPFIVKINSTAGASSEVQVLGTHFNVMAYNDEAAIKTTLLEGAVKVSSGNTTKTIKPGEQALLKKGDISVKSVDGEEAVAWTTGFMPIEGTDLEFMMRQIGRWYDVAVVYEKGIVPTIAFEGKIPRKASILDVINVLNANNVKARLDEGGRRIVIAS